MKEDIVGFTFAPILTISIPILSLQHCYSRQKAQKVQK
jgi:hypothetical protein